MTIVKNILDTKNLALVCINRLETKNKIYKRNSGSIISCGFIDTGWYYLLIVIEGNKIINE